MYKLSIFLYKNHLNLWLVFMYYIFLSYLDTKQFFEWVKARWQISRPLKPLRQFVLVQIIIILLGHCQCCLNPFEVLKLLNLKDRKWFTFKLDSRSTKNELPGEISLLLGGIAKSRGLTHFSIFFDKNHCFGGVLFSSKHNSVWQYNGAEWVSTFLGM